MLLRECLSLNVQQHILLLKGRNCPFTSTNMTTRTAVLGPRESGRFIAEHSSGVTVSDEGLRRVAEIIFECLKKGEINHMDYNAYDVHVKLDSIQETVDWIFFVSTINFSFWSDDFVVTRNGKPCTGYFAACACVNRALYEGIPLTTADFMANTTEEELTKIFRTDSGTTIPLVPERVKVLREAGSVLNEKFGGTFLNCVSRCEGSAQKLLQIIVDNFESYRDYAMFHGRQVSLLKRAQILVSDIYSCLHKRSEAFNFQDICTLTMFADYRVPQVLAFLGALKYSDTVVDRLRSDDLLENGSELEVVLRGISIYACERITEKVRSLTEKYEKKNDGQQRLRPVTDADVDYFLWIYRRNVNDAIEKAGVPFHRVRCIYY